MPLTKTLSGYLRTRQLVLVLDHFEQVLDAARLVAKLLAAAPRVKVLVTSRERIAIDGEHVYQVPSLTVPDPQHLPPLERLTSTKWCGCMMEVGSLLC